MKKTPIYIILLVVIAASYAGYLYFKPVPGTHSENEAYSLTAVELFNEYENDVAASDLKYLGKVLKINGVVSDIDNDDAEELSIILDTGAMIFGISCSFSPEEKNKLITININDTIVVKGFCTGMLDDVVLNRCVITN